MKNPICMGKTINKIQRKFQYKWIRLQDGEEIIFYALFNTIVCINTNWQILDICTLRSYVHHRSCMFRLQIVPTLSQVTVILLTACIFVQMSWKVYPKTLSPSWIRLFWIWMTPFKIWVAIVQQCNGNYEYILQYWFILPHRQLH